VAGTAVADNPTIAAYLTSVAGVFTVLAVVIVAFVLMRHSAVPKKDHHLRLK
jgi:hypothetical protein